MPKYLLLTTLTPHGRETLHKNPDRLEAVNHEIEKMGCRLIAQYATLGQFDFVNIVEAPDNETIAHLSIDLGSRGTMQVVTMPVLDVASLGKKLKAPEQLGHK